jgi:hypothetical protein
MITLGQTSKINLLTIRALEAQEILALLEMFELHTDAAEARSNYFAALGVLGKEITARVGIPHQLRLRSMENQYRRRTG